MLSRSGLSLLLFAILALLGCSRAKTGTAEPETSLSGRITWKGNPVSEVTILARGANGKEWHATTDMSGKYCIPGPLPGPLKFKLSLRPPDPEGTPVPPPPQGPPRFPRHYESYNNPLGFEFAGGHQTYDIDLK